MQNLCLGFWKLGIFENWVGFLFLVNFFFKKSLIGMCPIFCLCICVGPLWQFDHVLRHFSICSCIFHNYCALLHVMCLTDCLSDSSMLFLDSTEFQSLMLVLFDHMNHFLIILCVFYTLCSVCASIPYHAHPRHPLGTSSCISTCTIMHLHTHPHAHTCTSTYLHALCLYILSLTILACWFELFVLHFS